MRAPYIKAIFSKQFLQHSSMHTIITYPMLLISTIDHFSAYTQNSSIKLCQLRYTFDTKPQIPLKAKTYN